jgi:hypothetical protein
MVGVTKKIALIGTAPTIHFAPWEDRSWTIWAHASAGKQCRRVDRYFDLHPEHCYTERRKNGFQNYYGWLQKQTTPVYMQETVAAIPASVRYPFERIRAEFPYPVGSIGGWMVLLALTEGVTHLGLFGVHYQHETEYAEQRTNFEFLVGLAAGRGVQLVIPRVSRVKGVCGNPLVSEPALLYGYETHTPELYAARKAKRAAYKASKATAFDPSKLRPAKTSEIPTPPPDIAAIWAQQEAEGVPV